MQFPYASDNGLGLYKGYSTSTGTATLRPLTSPGYRRLTCGVGRFCSASNCKVFNFALFFLISDENDEAELER